MFTYIIKRLLGMFPLLWGIITISFMVIHLAPGKPSALTEAMNPRVSSEVRERLNKLYGLDRPLTVQYLDWWRKVITLDFGVSFIDGRPVIRKIGERLPLTVFINFSSLFLILFLGIIIGLKCASQAGSFYDHFMSLLVFIGFAMPGFWLSLLLMDFFGLKLRWLPVSGITSLDFEYFTFWGKAGDLAKHLALPLFVSCFGGLAGISRYIRQNTLEILKTPYIRAARARGLTRSAVLIKHALPNTLLPVVTILGLSIPGLIGGSVIFESIFALPGVGRLFYEAVMARDYPMIMAELVIGAALTLLGNFLADIAYSYVDPRIRYGSRGGSRTALSSQHKQMNAKLIIGMIIIGILSAGAIFAPLLTKHDPDKIVLEDVLTGPSQKHILGTDQLGRDIYSRMLFGARVSLLVGVIAVGIAVLAGLVLGSLAGFLGGTADNLIMRFVDIMLCFPAFFLILAVAAILEPSLFNIMLIIGLTSWMGIARLVRAEILSLKEKEFILAARVIGLSNFRIILGHLIPNALNPVIVNAALGVGSAILLESSLSFLGLGVQPPQASWGNILAESKAVLGAAWWMSVCPGMAILITVLGFNLLGEALRENE